jgi:hypothetical protein
MVENFAGWRRILWGLVPVLLLAAACESDHQRKPADPSVLAKQAAAARAFSDGFEDAADLDELIRLTRWHGIQRTDGNRVEVSEQRAHQGTKSLMLYSESSKEGVSKADIQRTGLDFRQGDQVWSSAWFYLEGGGHEAHPVFLWDLEDTNTLIGGSPGRRIYLDESDLLCSDLKGEFPGDKKVFRQKWNEQVPFPKDRWVHLVVHMLLSAGDDGVMEVWQDGRKLLDSRGQTLPGRNSVYDRIQVGITAVNDVHSHTLYVDEFTISHEPLR